MINSARFCALFLIVLAIVAGTGCAGGRAIAPGSLSQNDAGFGIETIGDSDYGAGSYSLDAARTAGAVIVNVIASGKTSAGYFLHVTYDSASLSPESVRFDDNINSSALTLAVTRVPGIVAIGIAPFAGNTLPGGRLATITFSPGAMNARVPSKAPTGNENKVLNLTVTASGPDSVNLTWRGKILGDYDHNGEVNVADITPIAINYLHLTTDGQGDDTLEQLVDGDASGEISVGDITPIALHYLEALSGYHIYKGVPTGNPGDEPIWDVAPVTLGIVPGDDALAPLPTGRDPVNGFFWFDLSVTVDPSILQASSAWKVVPTDGTDDGPASNAAILERTLVAAVPPPAKTAIGTLDAYAADIAVAPSLGADPLPMEDGAPVIAYRDSAGGLRIAYYMGGWNDDVVAAAGPTFTRPSIILAGGRILVAVGNVTDGKVLVYSGMIGEPFAMTEVSADATGVTLVKFGYSEPSGELALAYVSNTGLGDSQLAYTSAPYTSGAPDGLTWTPDIIASHPSIPSISLAFDPADGTPNIAYAGGTIDAQNLVFNTVLYRTSRITAGNWQIDDLTSQIAGAIEPLVVSAAFVDGDFEVSYMNARTMTILTVTMPSFDVKVYRGGAVPIDTTALSGAVSIVGFAPLTLGLVEGLEAAVAPTGSGAWIGLSDVTGDIDVSAYPTVTGTLNFTLEGASQTGGTVGAAQDYGMGAARGIGAEFSPALGAVETSYIEAPPVDAGALLGILTPPAGQLYYQAVTP